MPEIIFVHDLVGVPPGLGVHHLILPQGIPLLIHNVEGDGHILLRAHIRLIEGPQEQHRAVGPFDTIPTRRLTASR